MKLSEKKIRKNEWAACQRLVEGIKSAKHDDPELPWMHDELLPIIKYTTSKRTRALALAHIDYDQAASIPRGPLSESESI